MLMDELTTKSKLLNSIATKTQREMPRLPLDIQACTCLIQIAS